MTEIKLLPYQEAVVQYALETQHPALFLDMRLGKTVCTFEILKQRGITDKILVVAPKSTIPDWDEHRKMYGLDGAVLTGKKLKNITQYNGMIFTTPESLRQNPDIALWAWDAVVFDESTRIKNPKAQITKVAMQGFRRTKHRFILSGLPAPESPMDYCCQFIFLKGSFCGYDNFWSFRAGLFYQRGYDWIPKKGAEKKIREELMNSSCQLSRHDVGMNNRTVEKRIFVDMNVEQRKCQTKVEKEWSYEYDKLTKFRVVISQWLGRIAGGFYGDQMISEAKPKAILDLLNGDLKQEQAVVFFRYNQELGHMHEFLSKKGISCEWITGTITDSEERKERCKRFQSGESRVMLAQIKCCRFGMNLSKASTVIYYSNGYSLEDRRQSMDRIVHVKKNEDLLYLDIITRGTIDESVVQALKRKYRTARSFMVTVLKHFKKLRSLSTQGSVEQDGRSGKTEKKSRQVQG